jgi:hypothetical protein
MIIDVDETDYIIKVIEEESGFAILGFNYLIQAEPTINYSNSVPYPYLCTDFVENSQETGGYAIVGSQDHKIIWLDTYASGNPRRNRTYSFAGYDSARPYSIDRYEDLGYIIVGWVSNSTSQVRDYILLRIDDSGNELMHTIIPGAPDTVLSRNLIRASTGGFVVFTGAQLTRLDDSGAKLWSHSFPGNPNYSPDIIECSSGGYALLNTYDGIHQNMPSKLYFRIFRYHENGTQLWNQTLEPPYFGSWSSSIIEMSSGGFTIGGRSSPYGSPDVFVLLVGKSENHMWLIIPLLGRISVSSRIHWEV